MTLAVFFRFTIAVFAALLFFGIASPSLANDSTPPQRTKLGMRDWSVKASPNLAHNPPSKKTVAAFVRAIEIALWGESYIAEGEEICSYEFASLRGDGFFSLVYDKR